MENLTPEARALYDLLKADTREEYELRFLQYKKESLDAVRMFVDDTTTQIKAISSSVEDVRAAVSADLVVAKESIGADLVVVKASLSAEIAELAESVDRVMRAPPSNMAGGSASVAIRPTGAGTAGPDGHREDLNYRGTGCALHTNSPVGGNLSGRSAPFLSNSQPVQYPPSDSVSSGPRVELMQFDGANPKLWQRRSEEYFHRWHTPMHQWVSDSSSLFVGDAVT
jgi:hypothetical protein